MVKRISGRSALCVFGFLLLVTSPAWGQGRVWVLAPVRMDGCSVGSCTGGWTEETTGGYVGNYGKSGHYWWATAQNDVHRRMYWKFKAGNDAIGGGPNFIPDPGATTVDPPEQPRLYFIRTWVPPANSSTYSVIEIDILGPDVPDSGGVDPRIPWGGQFGTNHQWLKRNPSNQGAWIQTGPGPQAGVEIQDPSTGIYSAQCVGGGTGMTAWLRKGDWLYVKWDFGNPSLTQGVSAIEITEANTIPPGFPPVATCGIPSCGGLLDLRCLGNADPLFGLDASNWWDSPSNEPFAEDQTDPKAFMVAKGDSTLVADGYKRPCSIAVTVSPGLPPNGAYAAHLDGEDVQFQLRYDGRNSIKWDGGNTNPADPFYNGRVFTLNETSGSEFNVRPHNMLYLLTTKNGNNGQLNVELVYTDTTSQVTSVLLYDWFPGTNSDSDPTSIAVGENGIRKTAGGTGFSRLRADGVSTDGGNANGAFLFVHPIDVDPNKNLSQIKLSVSSDGVRGPLGGNIVVFAATLISNYSVFDVVGGGPGGDQSDGTVDMNDFGPVQSCYTGPNPNQFDPFKCSCFDVVAPFGQIDNLDLAKFQDCLGYSMAPLPPGCEQ